MSKFHQAVNYEEGSFEKLPNNTKLQRHVQSHLNSQPACWPSYLNEEAFQHASVNQGPPPSFLTQTPLGTPYEEAVALRPKHKNMVESQYGEVVVLPSPIDRTVEQTLPASVKYQSQVMQPRRKPRYRKKVNKSGIIHRWIYEEVRLSMSKMSIMSLVLGLLFLGALFFIIGFLAAVATLKTEEHARGSVWQASNTSSQSGPTKGSGDGKLETMAGNIAGQMAGTAINKQLQPLGKAIGAASAIVPAPLQPFARYGIGSARAQVYTAGREVNPFAHRGPRTYSQQPYPGGQQPPNMQQQYGQPYPNQVVYPMNTSGYQQLPMGPQNGQGMNYGQGSGQQPMMMQQPYYPQQMQQQPMQMQQMAPQQQVIQQPNYSQPMQMQQMVPQQQIMQPAPYSQQMAPQQGYYR